MNINSSVLHIPGDIELQPSKSASTSMCIVSVSFVWLHEKTTLFSLARQGLHYLRQVDADILYCGDCCKLTLPIKIL